MTYNVYEKDNEVARAIPGSQLEIDLLAYGFTLKGTTPYPVSTDKSVPPVGQKARKLKTSADKTVLEQINDEDNQGYDAPTP